MIRETRLIALLSVGVFLTGAPFAAYVGLAPSVELEWGLDATRSAALYAAYHLGGALAAVLVIPRASRGPHRIVLAATSMAALAHLAFAAAVGPLTAGIARTIAGGAHIVAFYAAVQWIARLTPPTTRGRAVGVLVLAGYGGTSASYLLVAGVLAAGVTWRVGYAMLALPGALGVLAVWAAVATAPALPYPARAAEKVEKRGIGPVGPGGVRLGLVVVGYAVHTAELFVARFWIPYALLAVLTPGSAMSTGAGAYLLSGLLFAAGVPTPFLGGRWSDRVGTGTAAGGVLLAGAILAILLLATAGHPVLFVVLSLAYCTLLPADSAVLTSGVTLFAPPESLGRAQSFQAMAGFLAGAALPALVGWLVQTLGTVEAWRVALATNAVIAAGGAAAMFALRRIESIEGPVDRQPAH